MKKIVIKIWTNLDGYHWEKLEDALAKCIRKLGIEGEIENNATGNSVSILRKSREQSAGQNISESNGGEQKCQIMKSR